VIGSYFPLKRAGANFRALCPFHKEKTPSFNVNPQKQIWHCFGCGAGGDVFTFVMNYENLDFVASVRRLAERAGIKLEYENRADEPGRDLKESLLKLHELAVNFFHHNLMKQPAASVAREYLKKRKITSQIAHKWRLGYSPDKWDGLIQHAAGRKFSPEILETAGLALRREGGDGFYDRFRGRLMFPICDEQGRTVGFSGRILTDEKDQPKYVNSPETPIFQKGRILFALDKAKRAIIEATFAVVCEGQVDTISCHEAGIENVVAPQGTALTEQQARILKRYAEEVVLMFDADAAGQDAIVRSAEPLWDAGVLIRVAVLPPGHDPDSFVKASGAEQLRELIGGAPSFFAYLLDRLCRQHDPRSERGKLRISRQMNEWLARITNLVSYETCVKATAARLDISEDALRREVAKLRGNRRDRRSASEGDVGVEGEAVANGGRSRVLPQEEVEEVLLQAMLSSQRAIELAAQTLDVTWLSGSVAGETIQQILKLHSDGRWDGPRSLLTEAQRGKSEQLVSELLLGRRVIKDLEKDVSNSLMLLHRRWLESQVRKIKQRQRAEAVAPPGADALQKQLLDLNSELLHIDALLMGE
jgi:DNA primase